MTACHYYSAIANIEEVEMNVAEEDNSTTLEGNKSCDNEECDTDDGEYEYVPDPNYKSEPYHPLPCKHLRGSSYTQTNEITTHYVSLNRCGEGLQQLYNTPQVQAYLNCIPSKELNMDKQIYSAGQLRQVLSHTNTYF